MKALSIRLVVLTWLICRAVAAQPLLTNPSFQSGLESWETIGQVTPGQNPARVCLRAEAGKPAWVISAPLQKLTPGEPFVLSLSLRCMSGLARAGVSLLPTTDPIVPEAYLAWELPPGNTDWRRVHLTVVPPIAASEVRLALGALGGDGTWEFANLETSRRTSLRTGQGPLTGLPAPEVPDSLPVGWEPEGYLDGKITAVGSEEDVSLVVNNLEISLPTEVQASRGERHRVLVLVTSRSSREKLLTVSAQGPPGVRIPDFTVPIRGNGITRFYPTVQSMTVGSAWYKLTFSSGKESKSVPIKVHCYRGYPFFGCTWSAARPLGTEAIKALAEMGISLHRIFGQAEDEFATVVEPLPADVVLAVAPGAGDLEPGAETLSDLARVGDRAALVGPQMPVGWQGSEEGTLAAQTNAFDQLLAELLPRTALASPPFDVTRPASVPQPLSAALEAGLGEKFGSIVARCTELPGAAAIQEAAGSRQAYALSSFWVNFDRRYDPVLLRASLTERGARLPLMLIPAVGGIERARLDALMLGRLIVDYCYQGATGVTVFARPQDMVAAYGANEPPALPISLLDDNEQPRSEICAVYRELACELAAAVPLVASQEGDGFGVGDGAPLTYKPFLRGNDGIVVMWNNSGRWLDVAVETRCKPVQMQALRISYDGELIQRRFMGMFHWSNEAKKNHQPAVYLRVAPLQIVVLTLKLDGGHNTWLKRIDRKPLPKKEQRHGPGSDLEKQSKWWDPGKKVEW